MATIEQRSDIETLATAIARSPIVVAQASSRRRLPDGFEDVDLAILDWISREGRRVSRSVVRI